MADGVSGGSCPLGAEWSRESEGNEDMRFSKSQKTLLGLLTIWPLVYIVLFVGVWFATFSGILLSALGVPPLGLVAVCFIIPVHIATMLLIVVMTVFWGIEVYEDPVLVGDKKVLWMVVVLLGGPVGQFIHFYVNVWPEGDAQVVPAPL
jgi:hypothetical protein